MNRLVFSSVGPMYKVKFPHGYVTIWWDIMNETRGSYSADVTIIDYLKNHDIEGPWALSWEWTEDEILLSTVGVNGTQVGNDSSVGDNKWPLNSELPPRKEKVVPEYCKGGVIPSWCIEAVAKSSFSFQISVGRVGIEYYPPNYVQFTTPRSDFMCFSRLPFTTNLSKLIDFFLHILCISSSFIINSCSFCFVETWKTECGFLKFHKIDNKEDL